MTLTVGINSTFQDENLAIAIDSRGDAISSQAMAYGLPEHSKSSSLLNEPSIEVTPHRVVSTMGEDRESLDSFITASGQEQFLRHEAANPDASASPTHGDDLTGLNEDDPILLNFENLSTFRETAYGSLDFSDYFNPTRLYAFKDDFLFSSATSETIQINLDSSDFDAYLQLVDASTGRVLAYDDDSGSGTNAQLNFTVEAGGRYLIRATSYRSYEVGRYSLTTQIDSGDDPVPPAPPNDFDQSHGYGLVDASAAVASATGTGQAQFDEVANTGGNQWSNDMIRAPEVWAAGYTGQEVTVAVIDSGVDINHEDLRDNIWVNTDEILGDGIDNDGNGYTDDRYGWNFGRNQNNNNVLPGTTDPGQSHGTHVAGTIAASNNGFGITGVAHGADIMAIRMGDVQNSRFVNPGSLAQAIRYAVDNGADVINMSLGWNDEGGEVEAALAYAASRNVITVSAAGNSSLLSPGRPGQYATDYGLVVGAVDNAGRMANFSNRAGFDSRMQYVTAPGVSIYSTVSDPERYDYSNGTSMAAPHVAGVVALMMSANPNLTHAQVRNILTGTTSDMASWDGANMVNQFVSPDPMPIGPEAWSSALTRPELVFDDLNQPGLSNGLSWPTVRSSAEDEVTPAILPAAGVDPLMVRAVETMTTPAGIALPTAATDASPISQEDDLVFPLQEDWVVEELAFSID
jgi:subtilisin family serine protease